MSAPVFISYPRDHSLGQHWAEAIDEYLSQRVRCWRDVHNIKSGAFSEEIQAGIEQCEVMLVVLSQQTAESDWVPNEVLHAKLHKKPFVVVRVEEGVDPLFELNHLNPLALINANQGADWALLWREIEQHLSASPASTNAGDVPEPQRQDEADWLDDLCCQKLVGFDQFYTPLRAHERKGNALQQRLPPAIALGSAVLERFAPADSESTTALSGMPSETLDDALEALRTVSGREVPRLAVLGEPGAGKTFTLRRMTLELAQAALDDIEQPLPLLVSLKHWTRADESLEHFLSRALGNQGMGRHWRKLREQKRAFLLLDAINELPSHQREQKAGSIQAFISDSRWQGVVVSCRRDDFQQGFNLPLDTLELQALNQIQVHDFVRRYLANSPEKAEACFWAIAGGVRVRRAFENLAERGVTLERFWSDEDLSETVEGLGELSSDYHFCRFARADKRALIRLASNPFLVNVMVQIYDHSGELPLRRSQLFSGFVDILIDRERQIRAQAGERPLAVKQVKSALQSLAMQMQRSHFNEDSDEEAAHLSLPLTQCPADLNDEMRQQACRANLLVEEGGQISFSHQLWQEYFAADGLWHLIQRGDFKAVELWPADRWWKRNGWEVTVELLMEQLNEPEQVAVLQWLGEANGDLAGKHWVNAGRPELSNHWLMNYQRLWLSRIDSVELEPHPHARAAAARALGRWGLDTRKGVGLNDQGLPDIDWVQLPEADFFYQDESTPRRAAAFQASRYLVTNVQFQAFIDDDSYHNDQWWQGLAERFDEPLASRWSEANSPRVAVSWYEAVAFCRWLSDRTGREISLPTDYVFERLARGPDWRPPDKAQDYPWRNVMASGRVNVDETASEAGGIQLGRTSAVGVYPLGRSEEGIEDLSGNTWEWCLNEFENPCNVSVEGDSYRVFRGGSWFLGSNFCQSNYRLFNGPGARDDHIGFRLCILTRLEGSQCR